MNTSKFSGQIVTDADLGSLLELSLVGTDPKKSLSVQVAPKFGSNMVSFRYHGDELIFCDRKALAQVHDFTGNFVLYPLPNRVRDRMVSVEGKKYSLRDVKIPKGNFPLVHGLVRDREWSYGDFEITQDSVKVTTRVELKSDSPYFSGFPFPSILELTYTLTEQGVSVTYTVTNTGTEILPFGFALHPGFKTTLSGPDKTLVYLPASAVMEADSDLLPTTKLFDVNKAEFSQYNLNEPKPVTELKLDHVFTHLPTDKFAYIDHTVQKKRIHIITSPDFTHTVLYTMEGAEFICFEPQTCSTDAHNLDERGFAELAHILRVNPGQKQSGKIEYKIEEY